LTKTYGVSVGTVPKAVEPLVAEGLIEPSQGRGTFVRRPGLNASMGRFFRHKTNGENIIPQSRILNCTLAAPRRYTRIACD